MRYSDLVADFPRRTLANLDLIKRAVAAGQSDAYELTQLWNSLLGLIVMPYALDDTALRGIPLTSEQKGITQQHWPQPDDLQALVYYLRNAVAHCNVRFHHDNAGEICEVSVWNELGSGAEGWRGRLDVGQLEDLARAIADGYRGRTPKV